jgi:hypothetical protein
VEELPAIGLLLVDGDEEGYPDVRDAVEDKGITEEENPPPPRCPLPTPPLNRTGSFMPVLDRGGGAPIPLSS